MSVINQPPVGKFSMRRLACSRTTCNNGCAVKSTPVTRLLPEIVTVRLGGLKLNPFRSGETV